MTSTARLRVLVLAALVLLVACSSGEAPSPSPTAASGATPPSASASIATPTDATTPAATSDTPASIVLPFSAPLDPDAAAAFDHIRVLAGEIGSRVAGTDAEREAAEYIASRLEAAGYHVTLEPFDFQMPSDDSMIALPDGTVLDVRSLANSLSGEATGRLVAGGLGRPSDLEGVDMRGAVALLDRGQIRFSDKAANAVAAGAVAVVIVNDRPGNFRGSLGPQGSGVPVVGVSPEDAAALLDPLTGTGRPVTVRVEVRVTQRESVNVFGRPSEEPCDAYLGAHYDSVAAGPGANDNASGTAAMIELARTHRAPGLCVVAFGAEEFGLFGSRAFVDEHNMRNARFMLNFDMVAKRTSPMLVITPDDAESRELGELAFALAAAAGYELPRGSFPSFASSDHVTFSRAGVPALTVHSGSDDFIHQPQDDLTNVSVEDLGAMLEASAAILRGLLIGEE